MNESRPKVSVGLPVYNGEAYLSDAIDSILAQTFGDFELIISDNASTDGTQKICEEYAARDSRIRYYRNEQNLGAGWNFSRVFELSVGKYFRWAAHDDMAEPDYLSKCIQILDSDESIILCFSKIKIFKQNGKVKRNYSYNLSKTNSRKAPLRFADLILKRHGCFHLFGLIRREYLEKTPLFGNYISADRTLLADIGLLGRFHEIPEDLFIMRGHEGRSVKAYPFYLRTAWWDPANIGKKVFPNWRIFLEHFKSIRRAQLGLTERFFCYLYMVRWLFTHWNIVKMAMDLFVAVVPRGWEFHLKTKNWYSKNKRKLTRLRQSSARAKQSKSASLTGHELSPRIQTDRVNKWPEMQTLKSVRGE
jgi:glycosyltransferase involved in cell wall biosynthesis